MIVLRRPFGFCYSCSTGLSHLADSHLPELTQMSGSDVVTGTMINENDYHLDSYSHLVYIVRYSAHIENE